MTVSEQTLVPGAGRTAAPPRLGTVVMKFGGTSVGDPERIKRVAGRLVAAREAGARVVGVVSAMGRTTDELIGLAREVASRPDPRELDMLLSTGERISCALVAMAARELGHEAISLTGSQAGIITDSVHTKAKIVEVRATRINAALDRAQIVLVAGFQGMSATRDITTLGRGGRKGASATLGRVRTEPRRQAARPLDVRRRARHVGH